jgi:hypothetical protein
MFILQETHMMTTYRAFPLILLTVSVLAAPVARGQTCGVLPQNIGKLYADGFEFAENRPQLGSESQALGIVVTAPADGSTTGQQSIQVLGTFTGPPKVASR